MAELEAKRDEMSELMRTIGDHLTREEVRQAVSLAGNVIEERRRKEIRSGRDLLWSLIQSGLMDETNCVILVNLLKRLKRDDLVHLLTFRQMPQVFVDPVEEYLRQVVRNRKALSCSTTERCKRHACKRKSEVSSLSAGPSTSDPPSKCCRRQRNQSASSSVGFRKTKQYTCNIHIRVKAEYCNHQQVLEDSIISNKTDSMEKQLDCFNQASALLRSRDLGCVICDINFSDLSSLDSFWKDYLNGTLVHGLKDVFITNSLRQIVGNEDLKLLVQVDEEDYQKGRRILMKNLI